MGIHRVKATPKSKLCCDCNNCLHKQDCMCDDCLLNEFVTSQGIEKQASEIRVASKHFDEAAERLRDLL